MTVAALAVGLASCKLGDTSLPEYTDPAAITYVASLGVNPAAMTKVEDQLYVSDSVVGTGKVLAVGDSIAVYYRGNLNGGFLFDSKLRPSTTFETRLDASRLIPGWVRGLAGMKVGGVRKLVIGPSLAYQFSTIRDESGNLLIPPNSVLIFAVELVGINNLQ